MKPLIGLTCNFGSGTYSSPAPHYPLQFNKISQNYIEAVERAGGIPVVIPIYTDKTTDLKDLADRLDGIIFTGGEDVGPHHFGEFPSAKLGNISNDRDLNEIALANYVIKETKKPVMGICRGLQLINVVCGGTLYQDLQENGYNNHTVDSYPRYIPCHKNDIVNGSMLHSIVNTDVLGVNSFHHQAAKQPGPDLCVTAKSEDGIIEALELKNPNGRFLLAVQWHPEALQDYEEHRNIFKAFINAAEKR